MSALRIYLLGGFSLTWDDTSLPTTPGATTRSLLAYLLTYRDRPHTRDRLAGVFWPDLPDAVARRRLSQALWQIRRTLVGGVSDAESEPSERAAILLTEGDAVQINPDLPLWIDVEEFGKLVDWELGDHSPIYQSTNLPALSEAVELYRGDFMAGYYDDWLLVERERLRELFLTTLERLAAGYKPQGEYERALAHARRLASEDPWREEAHREVMRLCCLLGRDNEALEQFETCRQTLVDELGAEPALQTAALAREIAARTRAGSDTDQTARPKFLPSSATSLLDDPAAPELPLVGREAERSALLAHVDALLQGIGGLVLVEGEAGVGKTRLLQAVADDARWRGAEALWAGGQEGGATMPYGPLFAALDEALSPLRASQLTQLVEEIWLRALAVLLPSLAAALPDLPPPPKLEPAQEGDRLAAALGQLLAGWARIAPLLLVVEDLHWAGEDALDLLVHLAPSLGEQAVLLVGSYRSGEARTRAGVWQRVQALDRAGVKCKLALSGLDAATTGELIRRCLGMGQPAPLFESRLYQETQGNPLFVLETLRVLHSEGLLRRDPNSEWSTPWDESTADYGELPLPRAVEQTIARRLGALPPALERTIRLAAVLGERFDFALLQAASGQEPDTLLAALRGLAQRRFVDERERDYRFGHDKVRQAAYESIGPPERAALHRRAAEALETLQPERRAALAHHWTQAEVWDQAADYQQQAGDKARAVYANAEAVAHYGQALAALEQLPGPTDLARAFELRLAREEVLNRRGKRSAQAEELEALAALAEELDDDQLRIEAALRQACYHLDMSDLALAHHWVDKALQLTPPGGDRSKQARALGSLGSIYMYEGRLPQALDCHLQARAVQREIGDRRGEARSLGSCSSVSIVLGDTVSAQEFAEQALVLNRALDNLEGQAYNLYILSRAARDAGRLGAARRYGHQALDMERSMGNRLDKAYHLLELGNLHRILGEYETAGQVLEECALLCEQIGERRGQGYALLDLSLIHHLLGRRDRALTTHRRAKGMLTEIGDCWGEAGSLTYLGLILEGRDELAAAARSFAEAIAAKGEIDQASWTVEDLAGLVRIALAQGQIEEALAHSREILDNIEREGLGGVEDPVKVYLAVFQTWTAAGQAVQARQVLAQTYRLIMDRAEQIADETVRRSFLENVAENRVIVTAYRRQGQQTARLPRAEAPLGRPLRDDEYVTVTWTVDAPDDRAIPKKACPERSRRVARRRHRILRLLDEAQAQGAAPRDQDLAAALEVGLRTLRRDMAALRAEGHDLPTRWRRRKVAT